MQKGNENEESYQIKWTVLREREIPISNNQRNVFDQLGEKALRSLGERSKMTALLTVAVLLL